jgi:spore germination protein GerM
MIFWLFCIIGLIIVFLVLLPKVKKGVTDFVAQNPFATEETIQPETPPVEKPPEKPPERTPPEKPADPPSAVNNTPKPPEKPAEQPPVQPPAAPPPPVEKPAETRDRSIYFMQEGQGGADLVLVKVNRKLAVSNSPLIDSINALLAGPNAEEKKRGFISFVPPNTRLLSARVSGNTVYLNFNEEFRYNTLGREGCEAQLKQIVWTATEFPNVNNVQIQIDGKIVDFLIEGIMIRNPIGR